MRMLYGNYLFSCVFEDEAVLPYYKGSTFRGVFGRALKNVVCALSRQECSNCLLKFKCIYSVVFETPSSAQKSKDSRITSPPHPFVIEPPPTTQTRYKKDDPFDFQLLLFGDANEYLPYFIYAFETVGKIGIGKRINGKRAHFILEDVKANGDRIYSREDQVLRKGSFCQELCLQASAGSPEAPFRLRVLIHSPLRLKFANRLMADLPFHILVRAMLRRMSSLFNYYGDGEAHLDYKGMVRKAEDIRIVENDLSWFDWKRYSIRQDQALLMGGMVGSVVYEGKLGEYMPLIDLCTKVHLGKQTTFGLGKIKTEILE